MPTQVPYIAPYLTNFKQVTFFGAFGTLLGMQPVDKKSAKFLIIRFSAFGDVVQTLSVPGAIHRSFPQAQIQWITRQDMKPLLEGHPHVHRIWELDRKAGLLGLIRLCISMRSEGFTHIYDAHNNLRSRVIVWILRPLGFCGIGAHFIRRSIRRWKRFLLFNFRINKFEMPFSGQRDLLEPLVPWGISKIAPPAPQLFLNEKCFEAARQILGSCEDFISLAPSAAHFLKRWPKEYWKELILSLPNKNFVLLGGPADSFLDDIRDVAPDRVLNLAGKTNLSVSAAVVSLSSILVSNDTWLLHAAEQLGHKAIALMGPAPFGFPSRTTTKIMELPLACRPCSKHGQGPCKNKVKFQQCMVDITPLQVSAEIKFLLGSHT